MGDAIDWDEWFERRDEILTDCKLGMKRRVTEDALDALYGVQYAPALEERDELRGEAERLRSQLAMHLHAWRNAAARERLWRGRAVQAYTTLAEARQEAEEASAQARTEQERADRDGEARARADRNAAAADRVLGEQIDRAITAEADRDRYRAAWRAVRRRRVHRGAKLRQLRAERDEALAKTGRLRVSLIKLADAWWPRPGSAPEDRWDRGHQAAGRQIAEQLRTLAGDDGPEPAPADRAALEADRDLLVDVLVEFEEFDAGAIEGTAGQLGARLDGRTYRIVLVPDPEDTPRA